jgi:hypothetical protein
MDTTHSNQLLFTDLQQPVIGGSDVFATPNPQQGTSLFTGEQLTKEAEAIARWRSVSTSKDNLKSTVGGLSLVSQGQELAVGAVKKFWGKSDSFKQLKLAFGNNIKKKDLDKIFKSSFNKLPKIEVLSASILGNADGAFDSKNNKIYLSNNLINRGKLEEISAVLIEEIGHYLDTKINPKVDAKGDEGAIFSRLVRGQKISNSEYLALINENDSKVIKIKNQWVKVEQTLNLPYAIKAEGVVKISGNSDFDGNPLDLSDDALIYGGKGFTLNGNTVLPVQRGTNGQPVYNAQGKLILVDKAVTVAAGYLDAKVSGSANNQYANLTPPQIVTKEAIAIPLYSDIRQQELNRAIPSGSVTTLFNIDNYSLKTAVQWAQTFPTGGTVSQPRVVRVTGGKLDIPDGVTLSNYVIIVESGDIKLDRNIKLNNVILVANDGKIDLDNAQANNVSVLASKTIQHKKEARFGGNSLLANGQGDLDFDGATQGVTNNDNLRVISAGKLKFNSDRATRGSFLSQDDFEAKRNNEIHGTIASKKDITFSGSVNFTYANIIDRVDNLAPVITVGLVSDTGSSGSDKVTSNPNLTGRVSDTSQIVEFKGGWNNAPIFNYQNLLGKLLPDGTFNLSRGDLEGIYRGTLPDGNHTLKPP